MPALESVMVCCSIASWIATWSLESICSNSSIQQMPLSASISAPGWITLSWSSSWSRTTEAVKPAAVDDFPDAKTARGRKVDTHFSIALLAVAGSPRRHTLMSPRSLMPSSVFFGRAPVSINRMPVDLRRHRSRKHVEAVLLATGPDVLGDLQELVLVCLGQIFDVFVIIRPYIYALALVACAPIIVLLDENTEKCKLVGEVALSHAFQTRHAIAGAIRSVGPRPKVATNLRLEL